MEISYNGRIYNIPRLVMETDQQLISRSWWIMQNLETNDNYEQVLLLSKYWHNIVYKHCTYSEEIMNKILDTKYY